MGKSAQSYEKKLIISQNLEENGIFYALEELNMVEKELTLPQLELATIEGPIAVIKTNYGEMKIKLFPDQAQKLLQTCSSCQICQALATHWSLHSAVASVPPNETRFCNVRGQGRGGHAVTR